MEAIAEFFSSKLTRHCSCEKSLVLKSPSPFQKCLWNFVIKIAKQMLDKSETTLEFPLSSSQDCVVMTSLLKIYHSAKTKHNGSIMNFKNQEYDAVVLTYLSSIKCIYDAFINWRQKLMLFEATWNDTVWLKKNHQQFNKLSKLLGLQDELQPFADLEENFKKINHEIENIFTCQNK